MRHMLRLYLTNNIKKLSQYIDLYVFIILSHALFAYGGGDTVTVEQTFVFAWILCLFAQCLVMTAYFHEDLAHGMIQQWIALGVQPYKYILIKWLIVFSFIIAPIAVGSACVMMQHLKTLNALLDMAGMLLLGNAAISMVMILVAAIYSTSRLSSMTMMVVALPLMIPVFLAGLSFDSVSGYPSSSWALALGTLLLYAPVAIGFAAKILR